MAESQNDGILVFIAVVVAIGGAAAVLFRHRFVDLLCSVPGTWANALSERSRRRLELLVAALGVVFVLGGVLLAVLSA